MQTAGDKSKKGGQKGEGAEEEEATCMHAWAPK